MHLHLEIDRLCDEFEQSWKSGAAPEICGYLERISKTARLALLGQLVPVDLEYRLQRGELPKADDYVQTGAEAVEVAKRELEKLDASGRLSPKVISPIRPAAEMEDATLPPVRQSSSADEFATVIPMPKDDDATLAPAAGRENQSSPASAESRVRYFGDYELLSEIARGGMGVVYKARQTNLNRVVALKMILAGQLASDEEVQRFRTEAEAAANLDHPGIVPIYEIGQHEGQHFFSMGYVDGCSLADRVRNGPLPPKEAAELTKKIAEAIAFAHSRNVIHRDLKPANVLLDQNGEPKVTDFGLARKTDNDSGMTRTGAVMGTPSYMPPEQAAGKTSEVGPLSDVYSLGAILYCLLTGRPPFQAANPLDTLLQVMEREPVSVSNINPEIQRDLETICHKCLQKESAKRYAAAQELADDLGRWLRNEPILARPVGRLERLVKWSKNQPAAALLIGISMVMLFRNAQAGFFAAAVLAGMMLTNRSRPRTQIVIGGLSLLTTEFMIRHEKLDSAVGGAALLTIPLLVPAFLCLSIAVIQSFWNVGQISKSTRLWSIFAFAAALILSNAAYYVLKQLDWILRNAETLLPTPRLISLMTGQMLLLSTELTSIVLGIGFGLVLRLCVERVHSRFGGDRDMVLFAAKVGGVLSIVIMDYLITVELENELSKMQSSPTELSFSSIYFKLRAEFMPAGVALYTFGHGLLLPLGIVAGGLLGARISHGYTLVLRRGFLRGAAMVGVVAAVAYLYPLIMETEVDPFGAPPTLFIIISELAWLALWPTIAFFGAIAGLLVGCFLEIISSLIWKRQTAGTVALHSALKEQHAVDVKARSATRHRSPLSFLDQSGLVIAAVLVTTFFVLTPAYLVYSMVAESTSAEPSMSTEGNPNEEVFPASAYPEVQSPTWFDEEATFENLDLSHWKIASWRNRLDQLSVSSELPHQGAAALKIQVTDEADVVALYQTITVEPNQQYRLTGWIRTENVAVGPMESGTTGACLTLYDHAVSTESILGTNEWTQITWEFNSGDASVLNIGCRLGDYGSACTGTAWFDDLKLEKVDANL